jgi:hypothetical protein
MRLRTDTLEISWSESGDAERVVVFQRGCSAPPNYCPTHALCLDNQSIAGYKDTSLLDSIIAITGYQY